MLTEKRRLELSTHYWIQQFAEANHYHSVYLAHPDVPHNRRGGIRAALYDLLIAHRGDDGESLQEDLRQVVAQRFSHCMKSLADNASYVERKLSAVARDVGESDETTPSERFHLMTTELEWRLQRGMGWNDALFSYCVSSVLTLLLDVKTGKVDAIQTLASVERDYQRAPSRTQDENGLTLSSRFFHDVMPHLLPRDVQAEILAEAARGSAAKAAVDSK